jgi:uncharacterized protein YjbI with pentapeptide repeats
MRTFRQRDSGWRWRFTALLVIGLSTLLASWIAPAPRSEVREDDIPFPTKCLGRFNKQSISQEKFEELYGAHQIFLKRVNGRNPAKSSDPYAALMVYEREERVLEPGFADPLPPSNIGAAHPIDESGRLDLCGAHLTELDLQGKDLRFGRFMGARLVRVKMNNANIEDSWWVYSGWMAVEARSMNARWANLTHLIVTTSSNLSGVDAYGAVAPFSSFEGGTLESSTFEEADISSVKFRKVNIKDVDLSSSTAAGLVYEPSLGQLPRVQTFRSLKGLDRFTTLNDGGAALMELEKSLADAGLRGQAATVRQALTDAPRASSYLFQKSLQKIAFGVPYAYGRAPERLLVIGCILIPIFAVIYLVVLLQNREDVGIWIQRDPVDKPEFREIPPVRLSRQNSNIYAMALLFSLRMAFRIGWKDFNVGDWLARVQRHSYTLDSKGWARSVAGIQSLVSLYLLVLAVLSYLT